MTTDNVTAFPGGADLPENPMQIAPKHLTWCSHDAVILDGHTRTMQCADPKCGAALDPFTFLLKQVHTIESAWNAHKQAMRQANEVADRVTVLKREEQRLRAMVKRLQEKTGAVIVARPGKGAL
jgi:hypothetical protein